MTMREAVKWFGIAGPVGAANAVIRSASHSSQQKKLLETVKPGDLIQIQRGEYCHWAMYSDEPGKIFHIPAESKNATRVKVSLDDFLEVAESSGVRVNNQEELANKLRLRKRSREVAVAEAKEDMGKMLPYGYTTTNCEWYCTKWLYGRGFSNQVHNAAAGLPTVAASQVGGILLGSALSRRGPFGAAVGYILGTGMVGAGITYFVDKSRTPALLQPDRII